MDQTATDLTVAAKTLAKPREGLFAGQLALYIGIVLLAAFASYGYWAMDEIHLCLQGLGVQR